MNTKADIRESETELASNLRSQLNKPMIIITRNNNSASSTASIDPIIKKIIKKARVSCKLNERIALKNTVTLVKQISSEKSHCVYIIDYNLFVNFGEVERFFHSYEMRGLVH
jgi:hypothetical protein